MRETIQNANGKQFHAVSLSGGKDSTAMLLLMIERDMPIDMVLSADTGMEFPEMYEHLAKLDEHLFRERSIHITTLRHPKGFEYLMFDEPKQKPRSLETAQNWASRPTATAGQESASLVYRAAQNAPHHQGGQPAQRQAGRDPLCRHRRR